MEISIIKPIFGVVSALAVLAGFIPYFIDIRRGKTHPHILSWTGWGFVTAVGAVAMVSEGFTWGVSIVAANSVLCFSVAIYSIAKRAGVFKTSIFDYLFFILGIIGIILWQIYDNPDIAISFAILADLSFGIPTIIKVWKDPKSETLFPWVFFALAGMTGLVAVSYISYTEVAYPVYLAVYDSSVALLIFFLGFVVGRKTVQESSDKKAQTINTYNATASKMAKKFRELGARTEDIERAFSFIKKSNPSVLEIGCGDGRDAKEILKRTDNYLGMDVSGEMIKIASEYNSEGKFEVADIENYSFPKNIDLIFSFASLLHSNKDNVKGILNKAYSSLNNDGIFYISLKYDDYHEFSKTDEFGTRTYYAYTPEDIKELAGDQYNVIYETIQELRGQKWLTIALQK